MPKKRVSQEYVERARALAGEGKNRAAHAVIRAERNKAVTRGGEDVGDVPVFRLTHPEMEPTSMRQMMDDFKSVMPGRKKKKGK